MLTATESQSRPLEQLQDKTPYVMATWVELNRGEDPFPSTDAKIKRDNDLGHVIKRIKQWALKDTYNEHITEYGGLEKNSAISLTATTPYVFLRHQPVLCRLLEYQVRLQVRQSGLRYEQDGANVCMFGHLYVAGRLLHPESPTWPDMELVLYIQGYEYLFYGDTPKTLDEAHRKAKLAAGRSLLTAARDRRQNGERYNVKNTRLFREPSSLSQIFGERFRKLRRSNAESIANSTARLLQYFSSSEYWTRRTQLNNMKCEKKEQIDSAPGYLAQLRRHMTEDALDADFDWQYMESTCSMIWAKILDMLEQDFEWDSDMIRFDYVASFTAIDILEAAAKADSRAKAQNQSGELAKVWEIIQEFITTPEDPDATEAWQGDECIHGILTESPLLGVNLLRDGPIRDEKLYKNWGEDSHSLPPYQAANREMNRLVNEEENQKARPGCCKDCGHLEPMEGHLPHDQVREIYGRR
jgi:parvulin-like peptidyl-prolyl isomerase